MSQTLFDCPHCLAECVGAQISSGGRMPDEDHEPRYYFVAVCRNCNSPVIVVARPAPGGLPDGLPLIREVCRTPFDPIPNLIEPVRLIPSPHGVGTPDDLPANVASAFAEAKGCLIRGATSLAAMGFRCVLERASRALGGNPAQPLVNRLGQIAAERGLHPSFIDWAASLQLAQADMADADQDPPRAEVAELVSFVEMFLVCAFTLPARIERRRTASPEEFATPPTLRNTGAAQIAPRQDGAGDLYRGGGTTARNAVPRFS